MVQPWAGAWPGRDPWRGREWSAGDGRKRGRDGRKRGRDGRKRGRDGRKRGRDGRKRGRDGRKRGREVGGGGLGRTRACSGGTLRAGSGHAPRPFGKKDLEFGTCHVTVIDISLT